MSALLPPSVAAWRKRLSRAAQQLPERLRIWARGLAIVASAAGGTAAIYAALLGALALLPVVQVWLGKLIVDRLVGSTAAGPDVTGALLLAGFYVLVLAVPAVLEPVQRVQITWLEDRATAAVDDRLMEAGTRHVDLVDIERPAFQDHARLAQEAARRLMRAFTLLQGLSGIFTVAGVCLLLLQLHPLLPVVLLAAMVPHLWAEDRLNRERWSAMQERSRAAREGDYCARITLEPAAAKEVRVFGLGDFFLRRFDTRYAAALTEFRRIRWAALRLLVVFGGLHALALAGGFWYVAAQAGAGRLTVGDIALYLGAVVQVERTLIILPVWFGQLSDLLLHLRALFRLLDRAGPRIAVPAPEQGRPAPPALLEQGVALQQVGFRYPESTQAVLADVSAVLPAGRVTALVGANGAGKSTLVKLLTRMYDPDTGTILLDGTPLHEYDLASWRRRIAVVYQDFAQFALTLHENI
ncbi:MAG: ABC transporter ATP-binding protein, partial [Chloroflexota bacterium]|nr:ABC transporter ATP-binding protein [Chloroflexota bacterium]